MSLFDSFEAPTEAQNFGNDDLSNFAAPSPSGFFNPADAGAAPALGIFDGVQQTSPSASPSIARALNSEEDSPVFKAWKEKHKAEVEKRKAEGEAKQKKAAADGEAVLKDLYADRAKVIAANKAKNKEAEEEQKALSSASASSTESLWLTVSKIVDLNAELKTEKDTSRLREILISLRQ